MKTYEICMTHPTEPRRKLVVEGQCEDGIANDDALFERLIAKPARIALETRWQELRASNG